MTTTPGLSAKAASKELPPRGVSPAQPLLILLIEQTDPLWKKKKKKKNRQKQNSAFLPVSSDLWRRTGFSKKPWKPQREHSQRGCSGGHRAQETGVAGSAEGKGLRLRGRNGQTLKSTMSIVNNKQLYLIKSWLFYKYFTNDFTCVVSSDFLNITTQVLLTILLSKIKKEGAIRKVW